MKQPDSQHATAVSIGVPVARRHIFLCCDQTNPKCCEKERGLAAWDFLKRRLNELELSEQGGILRTKANCLRICEGGPIAVVYPEGAWYRASPAEVAATLGVGHAIILEASASFLGLGVQPPTASWGSMLNRAQGLLIVAPWVAIFPGLLILLTVMAINFLGDGLRDALDPRAVGGERAN